MSRHAHAKPQARRQPLAEKDEKKGLFDPAFTSDHETLPERSSQQAAQDAPSAAEYADSTGHSFGQITVQPAPAAVPQMKRRVSQPGDTHEREADQVADEVMRMPDSSVASGGDAATRAAPASSGMAETIPGSEGKPLDTATRAFMEPRFGHDFSQVRVHTDEQAADAASGYRARAYTVGSDIVFGAQEYTPDTPAGRHLIAHELTHVVQQSSDTTAAATVQREPASTEDLPSTPSMAEGAKGMAGSAMDDDVLANAIMHAQSAILDGWDGALSIFDKVLSSKSDKETNPNFANAITKFVGETLLDEVGKLTGPLAGELKEFIPEPVGTAIKFVTAMNEEAKRAREAKESATLRDFYDTYKAAITSLKQNTHMLWEPFVQTVRNVGQAMLIAEEPGHRKAKMMTSKAAAVYGDMRANLVDVYSSLSAQVSASTTDQLFRKLSEEWIRTSEHRDVFGNEEKAYVDIYVNPDFTIKQVHIKAAGGQKIAEELIKDAAHLGQSGVDVLHFKVPKMVSIKLTEADYPVWLSLDSMNRDLTMSKGFPQKEADAAAAYRALMTRGLPLTKEIDGD